MYRLSRFNCVDGKPDEDQIETWAESYYYNIMNIINGFYSQVDVKDSIEGMASIPFDKLVAEELEDESEEVIAIAVNKVKELVKTDLELLQAYVNLAK